MRRRVLKLLLLGSLVALGACQGPDVGQKCKLTWGPDTSNEPSAVELYTSGGADYVEFNNPSCENLVCIVSPAAEGTTYGYTVEGVPEKGAGYCSKPCVSNKDCYESETGLVCRTIVLDPAFLASLDPATKDLYLGEIQYSSYCGAK